MSFLSKILPFEPRPEKVHAKEIAKINSLAEEVGKLSHEDIRSEIANYKQELSELEGDKLYKKLLSIRPRVYALVREAAKRSIGQFHYDVQVLGGILLTERKIAEMKTGEGKTLTATLPLVLFSLAGRGAHIVTVNDYLARWQASQMGPIYHYLGLSVSSIQHEASFLYDPGYEPEAEEVEKIESEVEGLVLDVKNMRKVSRKEAYASDITYGTNNEFGFDYLRDNMAPNVRQLVQRDLFFAIVDEVDSILIDEARTPLIISSPDNEATSKYSDFARMVSALAEGEHFVIDEKRKTASLTESGMNVIEERLGVTNLYDTSRGITTLHHIEQALRARANYLKDRDYVVREGEVVIVDEFTGRLMFGRRYSEGLHQAIEAKEGVKIQQESRTLATITFQNLFRLYEHLAGMTGTAKTEEEEFFKIYQLQVSQVPTNRPMIRKDVSDIVYKTENAKMDAIVEEVRARHKKGQPVLIGTVSIAKNEMLAERLKKTGVPFELLNAKNHEREAQTIAQAGKLGAVTLATNIAGRGVDILLGGNPVDKEDAAKVREAGGLHIIGTERHESRRIDNQLRGRAGRQGDPGSSQFFVSMEDDLMRIFGGERMKMMMDKLGLPDDQPLEHGIVSRSIEQSQKKIEGLNFDARKDVLEYDDVLNRQRIIIYKRRRKFLVDSEKVTPEENVELREEVLGLLRREIEEIVKYHFEQGYLEPQGDAVVEGTGDDQILINILKQVGSFVHITKEVEDEVRTSAENAADREFAIADSLKLAATRQFEAKETEMGPVYSEVQRLLMLQSIDSLWMEHLDSMDHLRTSVRLQSYGQRDPIVEYKKRGYDAFGRLMRDIERQVATAILRVSVNAPAAQPEAPTQTQSWVTNDTQVKAQDGIHAGNATPTPQAAPVQEPEVNPDGNIGRNDPCVCGSGKKYKKCGLLNTAEHQKLVSKNN